MSEKSARSRAPGKFMGRYVFRGATNGDDNSNSPSSPNEFRIRLFDGRFDTGFVVREFHIWALDSEAHGMVRTAPFQDQGFAGTTTNRLFNANDNLQIAWSSHPGSGVGPMDSYIVDPDNFTIEDLYVMCYAATDSQPINFMIVADKYDVTGSQGTAAMINNRAQGPVFQEP